MFESVAGGGVRKALAALDAALDDLTSVTADSLTDGEVAELLRGLERHKRRLATVDHAVIVSAEQRHLDFHHGYRSLTAFLHQLLHVTVGEASARVRAARNLAPRRELTGAPLPPLFSRVAAAEPAGEIAPAHARTITAVIDKLPPAAAAEHGEAVEAFLVEQARQLTPEALGTVARRLADTLDPDGTLADERYRDKNRGLQIYLRHDGSARVAAELTAPAAEALLTVLDATAAPKPKSDGVKDPRSPAQRRHDGLLDALLLVLRAGDLPRTAGVTTTILLTMTSDTAASGSGTVTTGHGAVISTQQAATLTSDARIVPVVFDIARAITAYGTAQRIFTEGQRLAMIARDQGCSFPGCSVGALWCEAHHITDFVITQRTCVDDGTMLCGFHHREHARMGWTGCMVNGIPHWIPPKWLDPDQSPQRNLAHSPALV